MSMKLNFIHQGEGYPVILLHGLFGSLRNLSQVSKSLADEFSVYLLDQRIMAPPPTATRWISGTWLKMYFTLWIQKISQRHIF